MALNVVLNTLTAMYVLLCRSWERGQSELPPSSLLSVDGLIKLRMQRVFIGALCRQMNSCNQSERDAIFGRDSYERKPSNHHNQGRRQGATAIIEFFSVMHTSENFEGARGRLCHGTMASPSLGCACLLFSTPPALWRLWFCLCVFVCGQDSSKHCGRILMKFCLEDVMCDWLIHQILVVIWIMIRKQELLKEFFHYSI